MKKISLLIILIFILSNISVLAVSKDNLPVYNDFNEFQNEAVNQYKTGYSASLNNAKNHYAKFEEGRLKAYINNAESGSLTITKNFEAPYVGEKLTVQYDFLIEGDSYFYSYIGFPVMIDSDGNSMALMKITNAKQGWTVPGDRAINTAQNALKNTAWEAGVEYKVKIDINLEKGTFEIYIDSGMGYEKKETVSGESVFNYSGKNISGIKFCFLGNSANTASYYIDNLNISTPYEYIYVSPDGDDENAGSYEKPVKTLEKAYDIAKEKKSMNNKNVFVRVKSGEYIVDENYTLGTVNENAEYGKISFAPDNRAEISLSGEMNIDIPEMENFSNETLKQSFLADIKENYISGYNTMPLTISNVSFENMEDGAVSSTVFLGNSGRVEASACLVSAMYDKSGKLVDIDINNTVISAGERAEVTVGVLPEENYDNYTIKTYLWQDLESMTPIFNMQLSSELQINIKNSSIYDVRTILIGEEIDLSGKGEAGSYISLKMTNESGNIVYMNQIEVGENGEFSCRVNPQYMPAGIVTLSISSNGGENNE